MTKENNIMEKLGLTEDVLNNPRYKFKIFIQTNDSFVALIGSSNCEFKLLEYIDNKLYVDKQEKELTWVKDFLFVCNQCQYSKMNLALEGKYLDILVDDKDAEVRMFVAKKGYGLNTLVKDENQIVRYIVAKKGYGLKILVKDCCGIRQIVADKGHCLDVLVNDSDWSVRYSADLWLKKHNLTLEEWAQKYPKRCALKK